MQQKAALPFESFKFIGKKRSSSEASQQAPAPLRQPTPEHRLEHLVPTKTKLGHGVKGLALEHLGSNPLRLIIIGHNPSETAWREGHFYANKSNYMWRILADTGLAPPSQIRGALDDANMPLVAGVGFTDVGSGFPGTDSSKFTKKDFDAWRQPFYDRLKAHVKRAEASVGCTCGKCGAPAVVAFSGKRQFVELFEGGRASKETPGTTAVVGGRVRIVKSARCPKTIEVGRQSVLPTGWVLPADGTEVWVMPSTSGASALSRQARYAPWEALAQRILSEPWPRELPCACRQAAVKEAGVQSAVNLLPS